MDVRRIPLPRADPAADGGRSAAGGACPACHDDSTSPPRAIAGAAAYRWRVRAAAERTPAKPSAAGGRTRTPDWRRVDRRPRQAADGDGRNRWHLRQAPRSFGRRGWPGPCSSGRPTAPRPGSSPANSPAAGPPPASGSGWPGTPAPPRLGAGPVQVEVPLDLVVDPGHDVGAAARRASDTGDGGGALHAIRLRVAVPGQLGVRAHDSDDVSRGYWSPRRPEPV